MGTPSGSFWNRSDVEARGGGSFGSTRRVRAGPGSSDRAPARKADPPRGRFPGRHSESHGRSRGMNNAVHVPSASSVSSTRSVSKSMALLRFSSVDTFCPGCGRRRRSCYRSPLGRSRTQEQAGPTIVGSKPMTLGTRGISIRRSTAPPSVAVDFGGPLCQRRRVRSPGDHVHGRSVLEQHECRGRVDADRLTEPRRTFAGDATDRCIVRERR